MRRLLLACVLLAAGSAYGQATPTPATFNPLPRQNASFFSTLVDFLCRESADRYASGFHNYVFQGCSHGTAAGTTGTFTTPCRAIIDGYLVEEPVTSINYASLGATSTDFCWLAMSINTTDAIAGFTRLAGTHYLANCTASSSTRPTLPSSAIMLEKVTLSGGAITTATAIASKVPALQTYTNSSEIDLSVKGAFWQKDADNSFCITTNGSTCATLAAAGTNATGFFGSGAVEPARGGTGLNLSACSGSLTWSNGTATCTPFSDKLVRSPASEWAVDDVQCTKTETGSLTTLVPVPYARCADSASGRFGGAISVPFSYGGGTITFALYGAQGATTSGTVGLDIACQCVIPGNAVLAAGFGTAQNADFTFATTLGQVIGRTASCTATCLPGDLLIWRATVDPVATTHVSPTDIKFFNLLTTFDAITVGD